MLRSIKVRDYMATRLITLSPDEEVFHAINTFLENRISGAPVVDDCGELVGILSESDCLKSVLAASYHQEQVGLVEDFMCTTLETISPEADIVSVAEIFIDKNRRRLPVVEDGKLVGQISRRDLLRAMKDFQKELTT